MFAGNKSDYSSKVLQQNYLYITQTNTGFNTNDMETPLRVY